MKTGKSSGAGALIINADDWGRDRFNTDRILECSQRGAVSSASAMVFMADSERAAQIAREKGMLVGLHLNFTSAFSAPNCPALLAHQMPVARYLLRHRLSQVIFHPGLMRKFEYLVNVQIEEFRRLYGSEPERIDGHHHMHLCANVLIQKLLPPGTLVRRNFSFEKGQKSMWNRQYRRFSNNLLAQRHRLLDYFFSLPPVFPERLKRICELARESSVELETHPVNAREYDYLTSGEFFDQIGDMRIAPLPVKKDREHVGEVKHI